MRVLAIGTTCNIKQSIFTGQSVMFDGFVGYLEKKGYNVEIVDISRRVGKSNKLYNRIFDYILIFLNVLQKCLQNRFAFAYLTTSQSKKGFYRDYVLISILKLFKVKVYCHQYGANYHQMLDVMSIKDRKRLNSMIDYVDKYIVEGEYMKEQFSFYSGYMEKVVVIPNGLPVEGENMMRPKTYNPSEPFTLFYLSNLIFSKGYFDVLQAVNLLVNRDGLKVNCVFAGRFMAAVDDAFKGIANKSSFDDYVKENNLSDYISYFPGLYGEEKDFYFSRSNSFILPSYYINEGQPVSIIEAMAYGCVPIVTNYRHIPMMINNDNGCFVEPQSPESICSVVKSLINNPDVYHNKSVKSIEDYKAKFRFDVYASKLLDVIIN